MWGLEVGVRISLRMARGLENIRDEETENGTNIEHVDQETQPVALLHLGGEVKGPVVHHLRSIDKHTIRSH
jgi:hypothetical protein